MKRVELREVDILIFSIKVFWQADNVAIQKATETWVELY
jgi:hypothetical protein